MNFRKFYTLFAVLFFPLLLFAQNASTVQKNYVDQTKIINVQPTTPITGRVSGPYRKGGTEPGWYETRDDGNEYPIALFSDANTKLDTSGIWRHDNPVAFFQGGETIGFKNEPILSPFLSNIGFWRLSGEIYFVNSTTVKHIFTDGVSYQHYNDVTQKVEVITDVAQNPLVFDYYKSDGLVTANTSDLPFETWDDGGTLTTLSSTSRGVAHRLFFNPITMQYALLHGQKEHSSGSTAAYRYYKDPVVRPAALADYVPLSVVIIQQNANNFATATSTSIQLASEAGGFNGGASSPAPAVYYTAVADIAARNALSNPVEGSVIGVNIGVSGSYEEYRVAQTGPTGGTAALELIYEQLEKGIAANFETTDVDYEVVKSWDGKTISEFVDTKLSIPIDTSNYSTNPNPYFILLNDTLRVDALPPSGFPVDTTGFYTFTNPDIKINATGDTLIAVESSSDPIEATWTETFSSSLLFVLATPTPNDGSRLAWLGTELLRSAIYTQEEEESAATVISTLTAVVTDATLTQIFIRDLTQTSNWRDISTENIPVGSYAVSKQIDGVYLRPISSAGGETYATVASNEIGTLKQVPNIDETGAAMANSDYVAKGLLPLVNGYTLTNGAVDNPKFALMFPTFVDGNDLLVPSTFSGDFVRNLGGNATSFMTAQADATAVNGLRAVARNGTVVLSSSASSFTHGESNWTNAGTNTANVPAFTGNTETRPENFAMQFCLVLDSYAKVLLVDPDLVTPEDATAYSSVTADAAPNTNVSLTSVVVPTDGDYIVHVDNVFASGNTNIAIFSGHSVNNNTAPDEVSEYRYYGGSKVFSHQSLVTGLTAGDVVYGWINHASVGTTGTKQNVYITPASQKSFINTRDVPYNVTTGANYTAIEIGDYRDLTFEVPSTIDGNEVITFPIAFSVAPNQWDVQISSRNNTGIGGASIGLIENSLTATQMTVNRVDSVANADDPWIIVRIRGLK